MELVIIERSRIFGPFWGEFGWEITQWAPYVNARSKEGDVIQCMPGHAPLYAHKCPIQQSHPRPEGCAPDMMRCMGLSTLKGRQDFQVVPENVPIHSVKGVPCIRDDIKPIRLHVGCAEPRKYIVLHCRRIGQHKERNLATDKWDSVVMALNKIHRYPVIIVGSVFDYLPHGDTVDLRGASLDDTISYMRTAQVVAGASSGPMHLAQMAEAPVVVWSGNAKKDKPRYTYPECRWNHFNSPASFIAPTWAPGAGKIIEGIERALQA